MYALGALAALLFGYDHGIIGAALLFHPAGAASHAPTDRCVVSHGARGNGGCTGQRSGGRSAWTAGVLTGCRGGVHRRSSGTRLLRPSTGWCCSGSFWVAIGIASVTVHHLLAEMAPARDRGTITSLNQYMIM